MAVNFRRTKRKTRVKIRPDWSYRELWHMYWTGFTIITCKNSIARPIVNTQSVVVLVWIILGVSIKPGLCYDIPESLYGRTGIPYREHRTAVYRYIGISLHPYKIVCPHVLAFLVKC